MSTTGYVAFLRAINVGGRFVKMERLRQLFAELGFSDVRTFIQSGNVFFDTDQPDREALVVRIEAHLAKELGFEVPVILRTVAEIEEVIAGNVFGRVKVTEDMRLCLVFLAGPLPEEAEIPYRSPKGDLELYAAGRTDLYAVYRIVDGRTKNILADIEKKYRIKATVRFYDTTLKLLEAAKVTA